MTKKLLLSSFFMWCLLSLSAVAQSGTNWNWLHPTPQGNTLRSVMAIDQNNWYAVGFAGVFIKTTDAGQTWAFNNLAGRPFATSGQTSNAYDLHFFDVNNGIIVGSSGGILKTSDAGASWQEVTTNPLATTVTLYAVHFINNQTGYATGSSGNLVKTTDGGNTWTAIPTGVTTTMNDVWSQNDTTILLSTTVGNVRRTTDGGATWATVNTGASFTVYKIGGNADALMVAGSSSNARLSTDGGATWAAANTGIPASITFWDVDYTNGAFFLTGNSYNNFKTTDNGATWDTLALLNPGQPWTSTFYASVVSPTGDSMVSVGAFGLIQSRLGAAATPMAHTMLKKPGTWYDVWAAAADGNVIAVGTPTVAGRQDQIARSTDGGETWSLIPTSTSSTASFWSIDMLDNNVGYIAGTNSAIYKTTNGGASWDSLSTTGLPTGATFRNIDFVDANIGWVFAGAPSSLANFIYKTTDGGATWTAQSHGISAASAGQVYNADMRDANNGTLVTWEPRPYSTTDGGTTWRRDSTIDAYSGFLYDVKMVDNNLGYMVGGAGRVYKTTNGGTLWDTITVPTRSYTFYSLEVINPNTFTIFGATGTNFTTMDGGATWVSQNTAGSTLYGSHYSYDPVGQTHTLFVVGTSGFMFKNTISVVPVELAAFSASVNDGNVVLNWRTATELNNSMFNIERKSGSSLWTKIGSVQGSGTTVSPKEYSYTDETVAAGIYSYRLQQVDFDGTSTYSPVVEVDLASPFTFAMDQNYPNPFNPSTTLKYQLAEKSIVTLKVYDVIGNQVAVLVNKEQEMGNYTVKFDASKYASGMYIYKLTAGKFEKTMKMMLLK